MFYAVSVSNLKVDYSHPELYHSNYNVKRCPISQVILVALKNVWSPIVWRGGRRLRENFIESSLCALDVDEGKTIPEAMELLAGQTYIILTTKSHQKAKGKLPACDRFRIIIPFAETIRNLDVYEHNMNVMRLRLGADKTKDGARFFWPCNLFHCYKQGAALPIAPVPPKPKYIPPKNFNPRKLSRRTEDALRWGIPVGHRHKDSLPVICELLKKGWPREKIMADFLERIGLDERESKKLLEWAARAVGAGS